MPFSATNAAMRGFRIAFGKPMTMLAWAGVYLLAFVIMGAVFFAMAGERYLNLLSSSAAGRRTEFEELASAMGPIAGAGLLLMIGAAFLSAVFMAGVYRLILRPEDRGLAHLKLGGDELRLFGLTVLLWVLGALVFFASIMGLSLAAAIAGRFSPLVWLIGFPAIVCLWVFLGVRLSLAGPMTFAERRIRITEAWDLTRGRFWPLLGMSLLVLIFLILVAVLGSVAAMPFQIMVSQSIIGAGGAAPAATDFESMLANAGPMMAAAGFGYVVVSLLASVLQVVVTYAPQADAYAQLTGPKPDAIGDVFG